MKKATKKIERVLAVFMLMCLLVGSLVTNAGAVNAAAQDATNGVYQFNMIYTDDDNEPIILSTGSCFLINNDTILTCAHCVDLGNNWEYMRSVLAPHKTLAQFKERISYSVTITRDATKPAILEEVSIAMDWAVLNLTSSLKNATPLKIRSSDDAQLTEGVFALGFPSIVSYGEDAPTYTHDDVTITEGQINKISYGECIFSGENYDYIQTSCTLTGGNSGGPLVDENGYVLGICEGAWGEIIPTDYYVAVAINQVRDYLDAVGIDYTLAEEESAEPVAEVLTEEPIIEEEPVKEPEPLVDTAKLTAAINKAEALDAKEYTAESYNIVVSALNDAKEAQDSLEQAGIDAAEAALTDAMDQLEEASNLILILGIAGVALIVVVVVVVVLLVSSKKKKAAAAAKKAPAKAPVPAFSGAPQSGSGFTTSPVSPAPSVKTATTSNFDTAETNVLNDAGKTTVLAKNKLIRVKSGETVGIDCNEFVIGRERKRVNYCVTGNSSISRTHAKIVMREGLAYLVDLGGANGTMVNGVIAKPNVEIALKSGDRITLADEEFEFKS